VKIIEFSDGTKMSRSILLTPYRQSPTTAYAGRAGGVVALGLASAAATATAAIQVAKNSTRQ
jgi:hypothetical protein